jgi:hypothetical protein
MRQLTDQRGGYGEKKVIEVVALATCGAAFALLTGFFIAIISANGWTVEPRLQAGKERSIALSLNKDNYNFRPPA